MLKPTKSAAPAVKKIDAGKATSSSKPNVVFRIEPIIFLNQYPWIKELGLR